MRNGLAALAVLSGFLAVLLGQSAMAGGDRDRALAEIAQALAGQIANMTSQGKIRRVAVLPFPPEDVPVTPSVAAELHAGFLAALIVAAGDRIDLVARESLKAVIADLDRTGAGESLPEDPAVAVLRRARDIDLLALSRMRRSEGGVMLSYRAVRVSDSGIVASTVPKLVPLTPAELDPTAAELSVDQAVEAAVRYFLLHAGDITELQTAGIRFETSGAQPPFGRYLQDRIVAALEAAVASPLSGRRLTVHRADGGALKRGAYRLEGRYWDFGAAVELRLRLTAAGNHVLGWRERVLRASAGALRLRPRGDFGSLRDNDGIGPFAFHLTTDRGADPAYRIGEEVGLLAETGRDAWLYCFYLNSAGTLTQLLPHPHLEAAVRIEGGHRHRLMDEILRSIVFRVTAPVGQELLKCFAADRDIAAELPEDLRGIDNDPLPVAMASSLSQRFRGVPDAGIAEASVVITVHE